MEPILIGFGHVGGSMKWKRTIQKSTFSDNFFFFFVCSIAFLKKKIKNNSFQSECEEVLQ